MKELKENTVIDFINTGIKKYVEITLKDINTIPYQIEMINNNDQNSFLKINKVKESNIDKLEYDVSGLESLESFFGKNPVNRDKLIKIFENITNGILEHEDYFLSNKNYLIDIKYIFINPKELDIKLVYIPVEGNINNSIENEVKRLFKEIIVDYSVMEEQNIGEFIQYILNYIKSGEFKLNDISENIRNIKLIKNDKDDVESPIKANNQNSNSKQNNPKPDISSKSSGDNKNPDKVINKVNNKNLDNNVNQKDNNQKINSQNIDRSNIQNINYSPSHMTKSIQNKDNNGMIIGIIVSQVVAVILIIYIFMAKIRLGFPLVRYTPQIKIVLVALILILDLIIVAILVISNKKSKRYMSNSPLRKERYTQNISKAVNNQADNNGFVNNNYNPSVNLAKREISSSTDIDSDGYDTVLLDNNSAYLVIQNGDLSEKIYLTKDINKLGRLASEVDNLIQGRAVGKVHAQILVNENEYFIEDLNSKNGTFINGNRLKIGEKIKLSDGDKVSLANVHLIFKES